jgi:hypothetical protein
LGFRLLLLLAVFGAAATMYALVGKSLALPVWAVAEIEQRLNHAVGQALPGAALAMGGINVTLGDDWVPHLALEDVRLLQPGGQTLLSLPETYLSLDPEGLLQGKLRAKSLRIIGARLAVERDKNGHLDLALAGPGQPAEIENEAPGPAQVGSLAGLFAAADRIFAQPGLGHLTRIDAEALSISLTDLREGKTWEVGDGRLRFENRPGELAAELGMSLVAGGAAPARAARAAAA